MACDRPARVFLRLDNGDTIRGYPGSSANGAQLVKCQQLIEQEQLTSEEQAQRLQHISQIYHRLHQPAGDPATQGAACAVHDAAAAPFKAADPGASRTNGASVPASNGTKQHTNHDAHGDASMHDAFAAPAPTAAPAPAPPAPAAPAAPAAAPPRPKPAPAKQPAPAPAKQPAHRAAPPPAQHEVKPVSRVAGSRMPADVKRKLRIIMDLVDKSDKRSIFKNPVKGVPGYDNVVKEPMWFKQIRRKLENGDYSHAAQFQRDMDLVFHNCWLFNGGAAHSEVGRYGEEVGSVWRHQWATSGLDEGDAQAAKRQHTEPHALEAQAPPAQAPRRASPAPPPAKPPKPAKPAKPAKNHTAPQNHKKPEQAAPFPAVRSDALFAWIGSDECGESGQEAVLQFLHSIGVQLPVDEDGEACLDPDELSAPVLWKLDAFCQKQSKGRYAPDKPAKPAPVARGPRVQKLADSDDDYSE